MLRKAFAVCLIALASQAQAGLINFSGTFSGTDASFAIPTISGSFGITFDDSVVPPGNPIFYNFPLSSLTFLPDPYAGTFSFDTSNTAAQLEYRDGALVRLDIGGLSNGVGAVAFGTNDFLVSFVSSILNPRINPVQAIWTTVVSPILIDAGFSSSIEGSLAATPVSVPEPGSLELLDAGLLALGCLQFRRAHRLANLTEVQNTRASGGFSFCGERAHA